MACDTPSHEDSLLYEDDFLLDQTDDALPSYETGSEVIQIANGFPSSSPLVTVVTDKPLDAPHDIGDIVSGRIYISPKADIEVNQILIDLHYKSISSRNDMINLNQYTHVVLLAKYLIPDQTFPNNHIFKKGFRYEFPFSLRIPEQVPDDICHCQLPGHSYLPQSVGCLFDALQFRGDVSDNFSRVVYYVRARIRNSNENQNSKIIATGQRPFVFRSTSLGSEILHLKNKDGTPFFKPNYSVEKSLIQGLFKRTEIGTMKIQVECPVIKLPPDFMAEAGSLTELLHVTLAFTPHSTDQPPPEISNVYFRLISHLISSREMLDHYMIPKESKVHTCSDTLSNQTMKIGKPVWSLNADHKNQVQFISCTKFPFRFPINEKTRIPTFYDCLVSRTYELNLTFSFKGLNNKLSINTPLIVFAGIDDNNMHLNGTINSISVIDSTSSQSAYNITMHMNEDAPAYEVESSCGSSSSRPSVSYGYDERSPEYGLSPVLAETRKKNAYSNRQ